MYFDGLLSREGAGARVVLIFPVDDVIALMYKLEFQTTNNIAEYEALILCLGAGKYLNIQ